MDINLFIMGHWRALRKPVRRAEKGRTEVQRAETITNRLQKDYKSYKTVTKWIDFPSDSRYNKFSNQWNGGFQSLTELIASGRTTGHGRFSLRRRLDRHLTIRVYSITSCGPSWEEIWIVFAQNSFLTVGKWGVALCIRPRTQRKRKHADKFSRA